MALVVFPFVFPVVSNGRFILLSRADKLLKLLVKLAHFHRAVEGILIVGFLLIHHIAHLDIGLDKRADGARTLRHWGALGGTLGRIQFLGPANIIVPSPLKTLSVLVF